MNISLLLSELQLLTIFSYQEEKEKEKEKEEEKEKEKEKEKKSPEPPKKPPQLDCPICMAAFEEPMSTRCGHIFCRGCINSAIAAQGKCPTCRKKVTKNQLIRVFLPSLS